MPTTKGNTETAHSEMIADHAAIAVIADPGRTVDHDVTIADVDRSVQVAQGVVRDKTGALALTNEVDRAVTIVRAETNVVEAGHLINDPLIAHHVLLLQRRCHRSRSRSSLFPNRMPQAVLRARSRRALALIPSLGPRACSWNDPSGTGSG